MTLFLLVISLLVNGAAGYFLHRLSKRLFEFEDVLESIALDVDRFVHYLDDIVDKPTFSNSPEILAFTKNMKDIRDRLSGYSSIISLPPSEDEE